MSGKSNGDSPVLHYYTALVSYCQRLFSLGQYEYGKSTVLN